MRNIFLTIGCAALNVGAVLDTGPAWAGGTQTYGADVLETPAAEVSGQQQLGVDDTATEGTVLKQQLDDRPVYRVGELLENTPGLIVTQHSGEGKANQYFLRGFNLDHGTDMAIWVDDMPVNMRTHAHGQGYSDLNFIIPELLQNLQYRKGPYFADEGDFATAGAVHMNYVNSLDSDVVEVGGGSFGYARTMTAMSRPMGDGNVLGAAEYQHLNGPWTHPDDYNKSNVVLRYAQGDTLNGWSATLMSYSGVWNATNQVAERADMGWGAIDPSDGGQSQRYSLSAKYAQSDDSSSLKVDGYLIHSNLDLWNNFTYYLYNPTYGDQFHQQEQRMLGGAKASYETASNLWGRDTLNTFGIDTRNDWVHLGLFQTWQRHYLSTDREDKITENSAGLFYQNHTNWTGWLRTTVGVREDVFYALDISDNPANSGNVVATKISPKGNLTLGPWAKTEIYISWGEGIHSNDARSATTTVEPTTYNNNVQGISGDPLAKFPLLVRAVGEEVGIKTLIIPHLETSLALFRLNLGSEQVFSGDAGDTSPSGKSTRQGVEWANFYRPAPGWILDGDLAVTQARFRGGDISDGITSGKYIAGSPRTVIGAGIAWDESAAEGGGPWFAGLQYRFFGERPLTNDNSVRSADTNLINTRVGYRFTPAMAVRLDIDNALDSRAQQIAYYYASRLKTDPAALVGTGINDVHEHPAEPLGIRVTLDAKF